MTPNVKKPGSTPSGKADKKKPVTISLANKSIISCSYNSTPIDVLRTLGKADDRSLIMGIYRGKRIDLRAPLRIDGQLEFCHLKSPEGTEAFRRGITMLISYLIREINPNARLVVEHSLNRGLYCEFRNLSAGLRPAIVWLKNRIKEFVSLDVPFEYRRVPFEEALSIFERQGEWEKRELISAIGKKRVVLYGINDYWQIFTGPLPPATGHLEKYHIRSYAPGIIVGFRAAPENNQPESTNLVRDQRKLFSVYSEHERWGRILEVENVCALNRAVKNSSHSELMKVAEALHEKKIAGIADTITRRLKRYRLIMIAGPSSSGKTTFSKRLMIQLKVNGLKPVILNLDDYFVNRELTPKDNTGQYDYEALEALDLELFNRNVSDLLDGKKVELPDFDFGEGRRFYKGRFLALSSPYQPVLVEGIHGLNAAIAPCVTPQQRLRIYISALTSININDLNRIPSSDNRLIRRIVRDNLFRSYSARETINRWPSVRAGEARHIFSRQEEADIYFNSALVYELAVFKQYAMQLLRDIEPYEPEYPTACRLLEILELFNLIPDDEVPPTSILREFIGGSSFDY